MSINKYRKWLIVVGLAVIVLTGLIIYRGWQLAHPPITITTDSTPVTLELNDKSFTINTSPQTLRPPKAAYNYRAVNSGNQNAIDLYGSVDTVANSSGSINLRYSIYSESEIRKALCRIEGNSGDQCSFKDKELHIKFAADHSWAIVTFAQDADELKGTAIIALRLNSVGEWQKAAGPFPTAADFNGLVPAEIIEVIKQ